ncbi:DUF1700 domain-containing protein [Pseudoflavonifractor capillosus]|uniref:DUF1700 domain-containing protein n=1 Tax=Pseudoflavonifractor capillosus TaxID=106588 RepID=UPI0019571AB6|nr:DUF1700 domain-containing protein [Pseudoflavonifractor capillosus]MBM6693315.1 DUF1700 domain-containing protein [Pseudoflavonifractor capillosus]
MNKQEFLAALQAGLKGLPRGDIQHWVEFYREMVEDRMEDDMSEEEAVAALGPVRDLVAQILSETPLPRLVHEKVKPKRPMKAWEIILLVLGSPVWVPLACAAVLVLLAGYAVLWACIITLYAVDLTAALGGVALIISALFYFPPNHVLSQIFFGGTGLMSAGIAVLLFLVSGKVTTWLLRLSKKALLAVKFRFVQKEATL